VCLWPRVADRVEQPAATSCLSTAWRASFVSCIRERLSGTNERGCGRPQQAALTACSRMLPATLLAARWYAGPSIPSMSSRFLSVASTALEWWTRRPWEAKELFVTFVSAAGSTPAARSPPGGKLYRLRKLTR